MVSNMPPVALIQRRWCIGLVIIQGWVQSLVYWLNEFSQSQEHVYNPGWPITSPGVPPKASPHHWLRSRLRNLFNFSALRGTRILCFKLCHFLPLKKKWFSWQQEYGTVIFRPPFWGLWAEQPSQHGHLNEEALILCKASTWKTMGTFTFYVQLGNCLSNEHNKEIYSRLLQVQLGLRPTF